MWKLHSPVQLRSLLVFRIVCRQVLLNSAILEYRMLQSHCTTGLNLSRNTNSRLCVPQQIVDLCSGFDLQT